MVISGLKSDLAKTVAFWAHEKSKNPNSFSVRGLRSDAPSRAVAIGFHSSLPGDELNLPKTSTRLHEGP